jgi:predicted outer membrane repeat protein
MKKILCILVVILTATILKAQTPIYGTWTTNTPINSNCYVPAGQTLTITSGVTITFQGQYSIRVYGSLNATGTSGNPVTFTASNQGSGWRGIRFINYTSGATSSFTYCVFEYANKSDSCTANPTMSYPTNIVHSGGAIYMHNASSNVSFNYCEFSNNLVCARGGAMLCSNSSPTVSNSTFYNNVAYYHGGAICCQNSSSPTIQTSDIYLNNSEQGGGGGIWIEDESDPTIDDNDIYENNAGNTSSAFGGGIGIYDDCAPDITDNDIYDNNVFNNGGHCGGGGIYVYESEPFIDGNTIESNYSELDGGGILLDGESDDFYISDNIIYDNNCDGDGGGLYSYKTKPFFEDNEVYENSAYINGGGMYLESTSMPCNDNDIYNNTATTGKGGGIYCKDCYAIFNNSSDNTNKISGNDAYINGGGAYLEGGSVTFVKISFYMNTAQDGAGVYCEGGAPRFIGISEDYAISYNTASADGGGIYMEDCAYNSTLGRYPTIGSCEISENDADGNGAGIYIEGGIAHIANALIHNNEAVDDGGAVYVKDADPEFYNCTVAFNFAIYGDCDGIFIPDNPIYGTLSDPLFNNCIVYFHGDHDVYYAGDDPDDLDDKYYGCDFEIWVTGSPSQYNNISLDPEFKDQNNNDFRISYNASSPCIDGGGNGYIYPYYISFLEDYDIRGTTPTVDFDRIVDVSSNTVDIGAYEYEDPTPSYKQIPSDSSNYFKIDLLTNVNVYPIPAKDFVFLRLQSEESGMLQVRIIGITGKVVDELEYNLIEGENNILIQRNGLPSGTYYLQINSNNIVYSKPVKILFN